MFVDTLEFFSRIDSQKLEGRDNSMPMGRLVPFNFPFNSEHVRICCVCAKNAGTKSEVLSQRVTISNYIIFRTFRDVWVDLPLCRECNKKTVYRFAKFVRGGLYLRFTNREYQLLFDALNSEEALELKRIESRLYLLAGLFPIAQASGENLAPLIREVDQLIDRVSLLGTQDMAEFHRRQFQKYR